MRSEIGDLGRFKRREQSWNENQEWLMRTGNAYQIHHKIQVTRNTETSHFRVKAGLIPKSARKYSLKEGSPVTVCCRMFRFLPNIWCGELAASPTELGASGRLSSTGLQTWGGSPGLQTWDGSPGLQTWNDSPNPDFSISSHIAKIK